MMRAHRTATESTYARVMRAGIGAQLVGVFVLCVLLFARAPIVMMLSLSAGALLIVIGILVWLWGIVWGRR